MQNPQSEIYILESKMTRPRSAILHFDICILHFDLRSQRQFLVLDSWFYLLPSSIRRSGNF